MSNRRPILVTGSHRSGTTWVGRTLARARGVSYVGEPFNPFHRSGICATRWDHWYTYICRENAAEFEEDLSRTLEQRFDLGAGLRAVRSPRDALRLVSDHTYMQRNRFAGRRPVVKDPIAFFSAPWLAGRFDMQVVVLLRHPAAFASSLMRLNWQFDFRNWLDQPLLMRDLLAPFESEIRAQVEQPADVIAQAGLLWKVIYAVAERFTEEHPDWIFIRHEDLSLDPRGEFERLFDQLDLSFDDAIRAHVEETTGAGNPTEAPNRTVHSLRRDSRANITAWKRRLSSTDVDRLRAVTMTVAERHYSEQEW